MGPRSVTEEGKMNAKHEAVRIIGILLVCLCTVWFSCDDDGGTGTNSQIFFSLPSAGIYTIVATTYTAGDTGSYTLTLN